MARAPVFVVGAEGLLGGHVVRSLVSRRYPVRAPRRRDDPMWHLTDVPVEWVDVEDGSQDTLARLASGCEGAIVAQEPVTGSAPGVWSTESVARTRALARALARAEVGKVVWRSHAAAIGGEDGASRGEDDTRAVVEGDDPWSAAALAAEEELYFEWDDGFEFVLVVPTVVVGPGDAAGTGAGAWVKGIARGRTRWVRAGHVDIVDARDVARAMVAALDVGHAGRRYVVSGERWAIGELARVVSEAGGVRAPRVLPRMGVSSRLRGRLRDVVDRLNHAGMYRAQARYDVDRARGELGYRPRKTEGSVKEALAWYDAYDP